MPRVFTEDVIGIVVLVVVVGAFPAFVFGLIYAALVRETLRENSDGIITDIQSESPRL